MMGRLIQVVVRGTPVASGQLQFNRNTGSAYRPKKHTDRKNDVAAASENRMYELEAENTYFVKGTPLVLGVLFYFPYRQQDYRTGKYSNELKVNAPKYVLGKKDIDNMLKPLKDGMKGIIYYDDKEIVGYREHWKLYSLNPRTVITVTQAED